MANSSIISIPPNVDDPTVLRRVLTRITEQLDTVYGSRTSESSAYVPQSQLTQRVSELQRELSAATQSNVETTDKAVSRISRELEEIQQQLDTIEQQITDLDTRVTDIELVLTLGVSGTFTTADSKRVTVTDGIITGIV